MGKLGSAADLVRFPGGDEVSPIAFGTDWVRVVVPYTWSGDIQAYISSTGTWTDPAAIEITYSLAGNFWNPASATWGIEGPAPDGIAFADLEQQLINSFDAWSCASDFSHTYLGPLSEPHTENSFEWANPGPGSSIVAQTVLVTFTDGEMIGFFTLFNDEDYDWGIDEPGKLDVAAVATHEIGLALGLGGQFGALDFPESMHGFWYEGETYHRTLHN